MNETESLDQVTFLLAERLLKIFAYEESDPAREPVAFIGAIPREFLRARAAMLARDEDTPEWYLITEEGGGQWDEELRDLYGALVVHVDDLAAARERIISTFASRDETPATVKSRPLALLVGGAVREAVRELRVKLRDPVVA